MMRSWVICLTGLMIFLMSCSTKSRTPVVTAADSLKIVEDNLRHRAEMDQFFRSDAGSPFVRDTSIVFHGLQWFAIDPRFCATSVLHRYDRPDTVTILGTKGEERRHLRYGYFEFILPGDDHESRELRLNVYKFTPADGQRYLLYKDYLSTWFTDRTTGKETYRVGRYVEIGQENPDPEYRYTIDFNKAFNPYCAYSGLYSCAIPGKEDYLDVSLEVGERPYHE